MGLLDGLLGSMGGNQSPQLGGVLGALLGGGGQQQQGGAGGMGGMGGLMGLLTGLRNNGQGAQVDSWLGNGQNQPIQPEHLRQAMGDEQVNQYAQQAGMDQQGFLSTLAQHLPGVVDHLSPNGQLQQPPGGAGSTIEV